MLKQLQYSGIRSIILIIIIILKKAALIILLCLVFGSVGLQRAAAQVGPPAAPQVPSPGAIPSANGANKGLTTKLIRIYNGAGYFDDVLAEKLRPMLAKAFPSSMPDPPKPVPGATVAAPAKPESQNKAAAATHL